jgi:hypothetical protein
MKRACWRWCVRWVPQAFSIDTSRFYQEMLPPHVYLSHSYYRKWLLGLEPADRQGLRGSRRVAAGHAWKQPNRSRSIFWLGMSDVSWCAANSDALPRGGEVQAGRCAAGFVPATHAAAALLRAATLAWSNATTAVRCFGLGGDGIRRGLQWLYTVVFDGAELWGPDATGVDIDRCVRALSGGGMMDAAAGDPCGAGLQDATARCSANPGKHRPSRWRSPCTRGLFTWTEWAAALAHEIKRAQDAAIRHRQTYYRHWLATLEKLAAKVSRPRYLHRLAMPPGPYTDRTPHGSPIELKPEDFA